MAIEIDLKQYINTYGLHHIKVIATGEGFRNSEPTIAEYISNPYITFSDVGIILTNVQTGVTSIDLYVDDVLEKTVTHDPTLTADVTIDFTGTSVTPTSLNKFKVTVHTSYGDFTSNEARTTRVFGVSGMYDENVELTRTDDAIGKTFNIDTSTGLVTSDFDNEFPYSEMTEVTIDDSVFISIPEMWWRIGKDRKGNITDIAVGRYINSPGTWYKSDAFLVGKYLAGYENYKMVSKSGKSQSGYYSIVQWTDYAKANGEGYKPYGAYEHTILTFLWLIEFANKRSVNIMKGYYTYNAYTGGTDSIPTVTGYITSNDRMKYRGIEDFVGNRAVTLPDVTGEYYTSRDIETYKSGTENKTQLSYYKYLPKPAYQWRVIEALGWDDNNPFICMPSKVGLEAISLTTYFGSSVYGPSGNNNTATRIKLYTSYSNRCSLVSPMFDSYYTSTSSTSGSRLIKYEI